MEVSVSHAFAGFIFCTLFLLSFSLKGQGMQCEDYAVQLDGKDDFIDCGNGSNLNITDHITIECWLKPGVAQRKSFEAILMKGPNAYGFQFGSNGEKIQFHLTESLENGQTRLRDLAGGQLPQAEVWYHLAGTYDGNQQKFYVNGQLVGTTAWTGKMKANAEPLRLGKMAENSNNWLTGTVDEVRVWNVARTEEQIGAAMFASPPANTPGLVAYYQFNEGTGLLASNAGTGAAARLVSGPEWVLKSSKEQFLNDIFASIPSLLCAGSKINIPINTPITKECPEEDKRSYFIELSDANGSFAKPTKLIGEKGKYSRTLSVTIPRTIPSGKGYRMRLLTSNPTSTSRDNGKDITIVSAKPLPVAFTGSTPLDWILCYEGATTLSVDPLGEATIQWKKDQVNIEGANGPTLLVTEPGVYYAEITHLACRIRQITEKVTVGPKNIPAPVVIESSTCGPGKVVLKAKSNFYNPDYCWYTGQEGGTPIFVSTKTSIPSFTTPFLNETTTYYVSLKIGNCESSRVPVKAIIDAKLVKPIISISRSANLCEEAATLSVPAIEGVKYQWRRDGTPVAKATSDTLLATMPGRYSVTLTNSCGKVTSDTVLLELSGTLSNPQLKSSGPLAICSGQPITLSITPVNSATYSWKKNGQLVENKSNELKVTEPGTYQVEVENFCGSVTSNAVVVTQNISVTPPAIAASGPVSFCEGGSVTLSVAEQEGAQYQWEKDGVPIGDNSNTYTATQAGVYELILSSGCGDTVSSTNSITVKTSSAVDAVSIVADGSTVLCKGSSVRLSVPVYNGVTYSWQKDGAPVGDNNPALLVTEPGTYLVEITTSCGLQKSNNEVKVTMQDLLTLPTVTNAEKCGAGSLTLTASGGAEGGYRWYTSPTAGAAIPGAVNHVYVTPDLSSTTTYYVALSNGTCESERVAVQAIIHSLPTVSAGADVAIDFGERITLQGTGTGECQWSPDVGLSNANTPTPVARPAETTTYTLTVTSAEGCTATDEVTVTVRKDLTIPNAFSPNGDGVNDTWEIGNIQNFPDAKLEIFNRWGNKLYEKVGYSNDWNGTYEGKELPVNTYFYFITYTLQGQLRKLTGAVSIIR